MLHANSSDLESVNIWLQMKDQFGSGTTIQACFFTGFLAIQDNGISLILSLETKILEFRRKTLEFRAKILMYVTFKVYSRNKTLC